MISPFSGPESPSTNESDSSKRESSILNGLPALIFSICFFMSIPTMELIFNNWSNKDKGLISMYKSSLKGSLDDTVDGVRTTSSSKDVIFEIEI